MEKKQTYAERNLGFITQSKLQCFIDNPEAYKLQFIDGIERGDDDAIHFILGTALDDLASYGKEAFDKKYHYTEDNMLKADYISALDKMGYSTIGLVPELKERYLQAINASGKIILTAGQADLIFSMYAEFKRQPLVDIDGDYIPQQKLECEYKGYKLRGTLDRFNLEKKIIRDWKTTKSIKELQWSIAKGECKYLFQLAFYWLMAKIQFGIECECILDVIDKTKNNCYEGIKVPVEQIQEQIPLIIKYLDELIDNHKAFEEGKEAFVGPTQDLRSTTFESPYYNLLDSSIQKEFSYIQ